VKALDRRLVLLEERMATLRPAVRLVWHEEVEPCSQHHGCGVERETGLHLAPVVHLSFTGTAE
jgi:hypothetical protein